MLQGLDLPEDALGHPARVAISVRRYGTEIERKALAAKDLRGKKARDKIDETLLSLELGATKVELDEMIVKLQQESFEN